MNNTCIYKLYYVLGVQLIKLSHRLAHGEKKHIIAIQCMSSEHHLRPYKRNVYIMLLILYTLFWKQSRSISASFMNHIYLLAIQGRGGYPWRGMHYNLKAKAIRYVRDGEFYEHYGVRIHKVSTVSGIWNYWCYMCMNVDVKKVFESAQEILILTVLGEQRRLKRAWQALSLVRTCEAHMHKIGK